MTSLLEDRTALDRWRPARPSRPTAHVFEEDPDLLSGTDPRIAEQLRRVAVAPRATLQRGPWAPPAAGRTGLGLLVLRGIVVPTLTIDGRRCPQLIGAGDLVRPHDLHDEHALLCAEPTWEVLAETEVAVLDERFARLVGAYPSVVSALLGRTTQGARQLAFQLAIAHIPRAEQRLHLLLWHLADRWGRMRPDGVHLPLPLTHRLLAQLTCMQRPTATNAVAALTEHEKLSRCPDGTWLLHGDPPAC